MVISASPVRVVRALEFAAGRFQKSRAPPSTSRGSGSTWVLGPQTAMQSTKPRALAPAHHRTTQCTPGTWPWDMGPGVCMPLTPAPRSLQITSTLVVTPVHTPWQANTPVPLSGSSSLPLRPDLARAPTSAHARLRPYNPASARGPLPRLSPSPSPSPPSPPSLSPP